MKLRILSFLMAMMVIVTIATPVFASTSDNGNIIVCRTRTGECYHTQDCGYLRQSCIELTLREAVEMGLSPCSRCSPPKYTGEVPTDSSTNAKVNVNDGAANSRSSTMKDKYSSSAIHPISSKENKELQMRSIKLWTIGITGLGIFVIVAVLFIKYKISCKHAKEELRREEAQLLKEKQEFIARLNGRTLKETAGVPNQIILKNDLPIDNNDAPYGSYTVYRSQNGKCYHDKQGCCSASIPLHYLEAKARLLPCSKCCIKHRILPEWYSEYLSLKKQAEKYHIDDIE